MARKKQQLIKWTAQDERRLKKVVTDFNKRVQKLKSKTKRGQRGYIPDEISFTGTRRLIKTKDELERIIDEYSKFKGKEALKKVTLKSGKEITAWEKEKLQKEQKRAVQKLQRELRKEKRSEYRMGTPEYQHLKATLQSVKNFEKLSGKKLQEAIQRIESYGSLDFDMRKATIYRKNYMTMLRKTYQNYDNYLKLVRRLNKIQNPIDFYEFIRNSSYGGKVEDIIYMYDSTDGEAILGNLFEELENKEKKENKEGE